MADYRGKIIIEQLGFCRHIKIFKTSQQPFYGPTERLEFIDAENSRMILGKRWNRRAAAIPKNGIILRKIWNGTRGVSMTEKL